MLATVDPYVAVRQCMHAPPQQLPIPPSHAGAAALAPRLEPAPTIPGADITSSVSALAHAGQGGAVNRSAVFRIRSNDPPHARQAYSYRGMASPHRSRGAFALTTRERRTRHDTPPRRSGSRGGATPGPESP
jgi:hypothetical protein